VAAMMVEEGVGSAAVNLARYPAVPVTVVP
jgi:hypothetical protein